MKPLPPQTGTKSDPRKILHYRPRVRFRGKHTGRTSKPKKRDIDG